LLDDGACAVLTCALMDLKKRDEYHQSTARDFLFSTCEAVRTHRRILVQTARVDPDWFSESVARLVGRPSDAAVTWASEIAQPRTMRNSARRKDGV
jgi:hypothetical protein